MARRNDNRRPGPPAPRREQDTEIIFIAEETVVGTDLDALLRREQTEALLELLTAHRSRVHIVPRPPGKEKPCD
jgi:hypothetical protein